jgi:glycosyltransferase involved in cell wall biosynthesis
MYKGHTVGVVVPAYNEEGFVGEVIDTMPSFVDRVYVVDDGSTDGTWEEIERHAAKANQQREPTARRADGGVGFDDRVVPIRHGENKGVGNTIKTGYLRARKDRMDVTAVMGGDGQMDPDILDRIIDPVVEGEADYAKGNRLLDREYRDGMSRWRFLGNAVLTFLTKIASGYWKTMDPQNGYTAISLAALDNVGVERMYGYYGYCNDLLVRLNVRGMRVADVAMPAVYGDEESSITYRRYIPKVSLMLLRDFLWRLKTRYLVLDFHPLALFYVLGAALCLLGALAGGWSLYGKLADGTPFFLRGATSLVVFTLGSLFLLTAMTLDMQVSQDKEVQRYE